MSADFEIERRCLHEKKPGIVQLSPTHLLWTPDTAADGADLRIAFSNIRQYQVSKEGAAKKAMIRLTLFDPPNSKPILDFAQSFTDRDAVRDVLNRLQSRPGPASSVPSSTSPSPAQPAPAAKEPPQVVLSPEEAARRQALLKLVPVRNLHRVLVRESAALTDDAFWAGIKYRYKDNGEPRGARSALDPANASDDPNATGAEPGIPTAAFVPASDAVPTVAANESGHPDIDLRPAAIIEATAQWTGIPTPAQRHTIFMKLPAVSRAFGALVPATYTVERFWKFYLDSSLAPRHASTAGAARPSKTDTARTAEADAVFAPFQAAEYDAGVADRAARVAALDRDLDLGRADGHRGAHVRTTEDVAAEQNSAPVDELSGRAATQGSSALRLMRMVNRHGRLVLDHGGVGAWKTDAALQARPLEDLDVEPEKRFAKLGVDRADTIGMARSKRGRDDEDDARVEQVRKTARVLADARVDVAAAASTRAARGAELVALLATMRP